MISDAYAYFARRPRPYADGGAQIARVAAEEHVAAGLDVLRVPQPGEGVVDHAGQRDLLRPLLLCRSVSELALDSEDMIARGCARWGREDSSCRRCTDAEER